MRVEPVELHTQHRLCNPHKHRILTPGVVLQLEQILLGWTGCVIVASHDRALLDAVAPRLFVLPGNGAVQLYDGSYSSVRCDRGALSMELKNRQSCCSMPLHGLPHSSLCSHGIA